MMGIDDIITSFVVSYITGNIPTIKDRVSKEKGLRVQMDACYQRALTSWCKNDSIRKSLSSRMFSQMEDLCNYIKKKIRLILTSWLSYGKRSFETMKNVTLL